MIGIGSRLLIVVILSLISACTLIDRHMQKSMIISQDECKNELSNMHCEYLASYGMCITNRTQMIRLCTRTCAFCDKGNGHQKCAQTKYGCCPDGLSVAHGLRYRGCKDSCQDTLDINTCQSYKHLGYCYIPFHKKQCPKSCGLCRTCTDHSRKKCRNIARHSLCEKRQIIALNYCRKSCQKCGQSDPCDGFSCRIGLQCQTDHKGMPYCSSKVKCRMNDHHTGIVCGYNNKRYKNLCYLKRDKENTNVRNYGVCTKEPLRKYHKQECKDIAGRFCSRFIPTCGEKYSRHTMKHLCYKSCYYCRS